MTGSNPPRRRGYIVVRGFAASKSNTWFDPEGEIGGQALLAGIGAPAMIRFGEIGVPPDVVLRRSEPRTLALGPWRVPVPAGSM